MAAVLPPPTTTNTLDASQRSRLLRSARKVEALLGETPILHTHHDDLEDPYASQSYHLSKSKSHTRSQTRSQTQSQTRSFHGAGYEEERMEGPVTRSRPLFSLTRFISIRTHVTQTHAEPSTSSSHVHARHDDDDDEGTDTLNPASNLTILAKRRKMAKLARTLGENVPPELVFKHLGPPSPTLTRSASANAAGGAMGMAGGRKRSLTRGSGHKATKSVSIASTSRPGTADSDAWNPDLARNVYALTTTITPTTTTTTPTSSFGSVMPLLQSPPQPQASTSPSIASTSTPPATATTSEPIPSTSTSTASTSTSAQAPTVIIDPTPSSETHLIREAKEKRRRGNRPQSLALGDISAFNSSSTSMGMGMNPSFGNPSFGNPSFVNPSLVELTETEREVHLQLDPQVVTGGRGTASLDSPRPFFVDEVPGSPGIPLSQLKRGELLPPDWDGHRKEKEWSGEWNVKDMEKVAKRLRGLKGK